MKELQFGDRFGRLTFLTRSVEKTNVRGRALFSCDCGAVITKQTGTVFSGNTLSCGCLRRDLVAEKNKRHGFASRGSKFSIYKTWKQIKSRCNNPNDRHFRLYGERGIGIFKEWDHNFSVFQKYISSHLGPRPSLKHSLDRIDNDGNYEPGNLRWATQKQQVRNSRRARKITHCGKTMILCEWAEQFKIKPAMLSNRLCAGWSIKDALTKPKKGAVIL